MLAGLRWKPAQAHCLKANLDRATASRRTQWMQAGSKRPVREAGTLGLEDRFGIGESEKEKWTA